MLSGQEDKIEKNKIVGKKSLIKEKTSQQIKSVRTKKNMSSGLKWGEQKGKMSTG